MLSFLRVFVFYVGFAALLTWSLFALGLADALELPGFEGSRTAGIQTDPPGDARPPVIDPIPKLSPPRDARPAGPERTATVAAPPPAPVVVAPPPPPAASPPTVVKAPEPPRPVVVDLAPAAPPRAAPPPAGASMAASPPPGPPPAVAPVAAPVPKTVPPHPRATDATPVVAPVAPPPVAAPPVRAPAPAVAAPVAPGRWAPARRVAGFGPDGLADVLDDVRRSRDDIPCVMMRDVVFRAGSTVLAAGMAPRLALIAEVLSTVKTRRIEIGSKLGPGRPMASDAKLRTDRAAVIRAHLVDLGVAPDRLLIDTGEAYERVAADVSRAEGTRAQSIGLCVHN